MENTGIHRIRLERAGRKTVIALLFFFVAMFCAAIGIGVSGPKVWVAKKAVSTPASSCTKGQGGSRNPNNCMDCTTRWKGDLIAMQPFHQLLYLEVSIEKPLHSVDIALAYDQEVSVTATGKDAAGKWHDIIDDSKHTRRVTCARTEKACSNITVFAENVIRYEEYKLDVIMFHPMMYFCHNGTEPALKMDFVMRYMNTRFTTFEMGFKYAQVGITLIVMLAFFIPLRKVPASQRSYEQQWLAILVILLFFFNDPFMVLEVQSSSAVPSVIYTIFLATFLVALLFFWLCILDIIRLTASGVDSTSNSRGMCFYLPKVILCLSIWFSLLSVYLWTRLQQRTDPAYSTPDEFSHFGFFKVLCLVLVGLYCLWLLYLISRSLAEIKGFRVQFRFIGILTGLTIVISGFGIAFGALSPLPVSRVDFLAFYWLYDMYVWILCIAYTPTLEARAQQIDDEEHFDLDVSPSGQVDVDASMDASMEMAPVNKFQDKESNLDNTL